MCKELIVSYLNYLYNLLYIPNQQLIIVLLSNHKLYKVRDSLIELNKIG